jgi:hypothetical protein
MKNELASSEIRKSVSHGRIGEAAAYAKCWMHGIPAFHTGGLRANFAGSDLIVETDDPRVKLWIQVKAGLPGLRDHVYLTQCKGDVDLGLDKFSADFTIFVNIDVKKGKSHQHDGSLGFDSLTFYVLPRKVANKVYRDAVKHWHDKPKSNGGRRKLANMAVHVAKASMEQYRDAWHLIRKAEKKKK